LPSLNCTIRKEQVDQYSRLLRVQSAELLFDRANRIRPLRARVCKAFPYLSRVAEAFTEYVYLGVVELIDDFGKPSKS